MVAILHGYCCTRACSFSNAYAPFSHMQQEMVTSGIILQFAKEIAAEVAEGGEMVRKEAGRKGGRMEGEREE